MPKSLNKRGLSKAALAAIIVIIVVIIGAYLAITYHPTKRVVPRRLLLMLRSQP